jgi:hypothetical protein
MSLYKRINYPNSFLFAFLPSEAKHGDFSEEYTVVAVKKQGILQVNENKNSAGPFEPAPQS